MNLFNLPIEQLDKELDKFLSNYTKEELLKELEKCREKNEKWGVVFYEKKQNNLLTE